MTNNEKQRVKRKEHKKTLQRQALQVKIKKHKENRKHTLENAFKQGQLLALRRISTWLQFEFPKKGKKLFEQLLDFINNNK